MQPHEETAPTPSGTFWFPLSKVLPLARQSLAEADRSGEARLCVLHLIRQGGAVYLITTAPDDAQANPHGVSHAEALLPPAERADMSRYLLPGYEVYGDLVVNDGSTGRSVIAQLATAVRHGHDALCVTMTGSTITAATAPLPDGL
ncbi:hypothetical protein AB0M43_14575 [Longispora sp. NPDC051575]|uniref:hypothetical protein n=1 Tax=Longispora sp. NPDC051575 TaxID=3154943 RepID=UPI00342CF85B